MLEEDHFGLDHVKERIIEYLAVKKLNPSARGPIICFVGPPGVGKTSLGKSIARAIGRKFTRIPLAECATKPIFAVTGAPMSGPIQDVLSRACAL